MNFYHCFFTDLPDAFIEANSHHLIRWCDKWHDNPYLVRSRIIDNVSIDLVGKEKRDNWPTLKCGSQPMLRLWLRNKGGNYNGRYWESLTEDQRSPDRVPGVSRGKDAGVGTLWTSAISNQSSGTLRAGDLDALYRQMVAQAQASMLMPSRMLWSGSDWAEPPRPALKRDGVVAGEIIGYRCWKVEKGLLRSVYQKDVWLPGQVLEGRELGDWDSRGIHAWRDKGSREYHDYIRSYLNQADDPYLWPTARSTGTKRPAMVTGTVFLWGDVVEHERGWRAEFARVRSLDWLYPDETMMGREQEALDDLRRRYVAHVSEVAEGDK